MNTLKMLLAEIRYRKLNFALSLFAITITVTLFVAGPVLVDGYSDQTGEELQRLEARVADSQARVTRSEKEAAAELARLEDQTRRVMRDMGFNLSIVHRDTDMIDFLSTGLTDVDMPEEYIHRLAGDRHLTMVTHLVATLRRKINWEGHQVRLDGYLPEATQSHLRRKAPMGFRIEPGTVYLGHHLAKGKKVGEMTEVLGHRFRIARLLPEQGSQQDSTISMHLKDAQEVLGKPGRINQILALECRCAEADLPRIRKQLADALPQTHVTRDLSKAAARAKQRALVEEKHQRIVAKQRADLAERKKDLAATAAHRARIQRSLETLAMLVTTLVVLVSAVWVGLLAMANVRERRSEIGLLRALGKDSGMIARLLLGKAVLLGLLGAAVGVVLGTWTARLLGVQALAVASGHLGARYDVLVAALVGAPLLSAMASYLPTLFALMQDPAVVLRDM